MKTTVSVEIEGKNLSLTNLNKIYFPKSSISKGELISYYSEMSRLILPHLAHNPFVMVRYPNGIEGEYFYQKECPTQAPDWVRRFSDPRSSSGLTYAVCDSTAALTYLVNLGCIEIHSWASTVETPDFPEWGVFDLDPDPPSSFREALQVAQWIGEILQELRMNFLIKTSGSTGVHVLLPLQAGYRFKEVQRGIEGICRFLAKQRSQECTLERSTNKREGKIYLDYLQNGRGKTMAGIYSVRPTQLGTVSTPLFWQEVVDGVDPEDFHLRNILARVKQIGDLSVIMSQKNDFSRILHYFSH